MPKLVDHGARGGEIAEAVFRVVAEQGLDALTIRGVATEAGWSTGVVAHYFRDKDDLLAFAFERVADRVHRRLAALPAGDDALARVRAAVLELLPLDRGRRLETEIWFGFLGRALARPELALLQRSLYAEWRDELARGLSLAQAAGAVRADLVAADEAARLVALVDGLALQAAFEPDELSPARLEALLDQQLERVSVPNS